MIRTGVEDPESFGDRVRLARQRLRGSLGKRCTQGDLAAAVGVERNTVSRWENGGIRPKDPAVLAGVARTLGVSTDWLLGEFAPPGNDRNVESGARSALNERPGMEAYSPQHSRALAALPCAASELLQDYLGRLRRAGCGAEQVRGATSVLLSCATNAVAQRAFRDRSEIEVLADVDAAWDFVTQVLRREGIRP